MMQTLAISENVLGDQGVGGAGEERLKIAKPKGQCICVSAPARVLGACTRPKKLSCRTFGSPPGLNVRSTQFVAARELELPDQNGCTARKRDTDRVRNVQLAGEETTRQHR